jgi:hypothetical protein
MTADRQHPSLFTTVDKAADPEFFISWMDHAQRLPDIARALLRRGRNEA